MVGLGGPWNKCQPTVFEELLEMEEKVKGELPMWSLSNQQDGATSTDWKQGQ